MEGVITRILGNKFEVRINKEVLICFIKGSIRVDKILPLTGDRVIIDKNKKIITKILPRKNKLIRPKVCNVTQGIIVASLKDPDLDTNLIDKILVELEHNKIKPIICFTKRDLLNDEDYNKISDIINYYKNIYSIYFNSEIDKLKKIFKNEISIFIGQSGAGKTTLLNRLAPKLLLKTNEISKALGRGRHTTRSVQMIDLFDGYIIDSPGFSALEFSNMLKKEVRDSFIEFKKYPCEYADCMHIKEDNCNVKENLVNGNIAKFRYDNYLSLVKTAYDDKDKYKRSSL